MSARLCMGLALHAWIATCKLMDAWPQSDTMDYELEPDQMRSAIGGYAMAAKFGELQLLESVRMDQADMLPRRLAEEIRRTERDLEMAKRKEAERKRKEMVTASENLSTNRNPWLTVEPRKHRFKSRRQQLESGEGCSSWADQPPERKLKARATLAGNPEPAFSRQQAAGSEQGSCDPNPRGCGAEGSASCSQSSEYDPTSPGYETRGSRYEPRTEQLSPPSRGVDLGAVLRDTGVDNFGTLESDLFDEALHTPGPPGVEDDVQMDDDGSVGSADVQTGMDLLDEEDEI